MNPVKLVAVFSENRKGQLSRVTGVLAETGVNIHWVDISSVDGFGVIRLLVDKTDLAYQSLKQSQLTVSLLEIVAIEVADQPGSLHEVARAFADHGLSLTNCSGFVFNHRAIIFFELEDLASARRIASQLGLHQLTEEEMLGL
jgi:hypothetical protein